MGENKAEMQPMTDEPLWLHRDDKPSLALRQLPGEGPGLLWLGGYASDMLGTKAEWLHSRAAAKGQAFTRFDYAGHGESEGDFEDGCLSDWAGDALDILDLTTQGPQILVGSSMGGWVAALLARQRPERLAGIVFIAPAPDFTAELIWPRWPEAQKRKVLEEGRVEIPSAYDDSVMVYTRKLFEDGANNIVLDAPLSVTVPVRILQGMKDDVVPWQHAMRLAEHLDCPDLQVRLVRDGDHRMSGPTELAALDGLLAEIGG